MSRSHVPTRRPLLGLPRVYWALWVGQFINRLGGFVLTFLPLFLTEHHHYSAARAGGVLSLYGLGGLLGASLGGWSSDRFGRRPTLLFATLGSALVLLLFGFAPAGPLVAIAALAHGVGSAYGPALNASVGDVVPLEDRPRAFGYFYWAVNLGFTFAALFGGTLSRQGFHWLFIGDAVSTLVLTGIVYALVPETRPEVPQGRERVTPAAMLHAIIDPKFGGFMVAQFIVLVVFLQSFVTMPLQERARGLTMANVGAIAGLNGVVILVAQPLFLRWTKGQPSWRLLSLATILVGTAALIAASARNLAGFAASMAVFSLGEVAFSGAAPSFVADVAPHDRRGTYQGAYSLCWAAASLVAPLVGPATSEQFGSGVLWYAGAAACALALVGHLRYTRRGSLAIPG